MKNTTMFTILVLVLGLVVCTTEVIEAAPMGTAFTYQGRLMDANSTADRLYDFEGLMFERSGGSFFELITHSGDDIAHLVEVGVARTYGDFDGLQLVAQSGSYCQKHPAGDVHGDCKIDFTDIAINALNWLDCKLVPPDACR